MTPKNGTNTAKILCTIGITCFLSSEAFSQQAPQSVYKQRVASVSARVPGSSKTSVKDGPRTTQYSPQTGFVIVNYNVRDEGSFGITTRSWGSNPGNYSFNIKQSIQDSYSDAFNLVASANLPNNIKANLMATLTTSYNANFNYATSISSSHATIWMTVAAQGQGKFKGGSGITLSLDVELLPILPWCSSDQQARQFIVSSTKSLIVAAMRRAQPPREVITRFIDEPVKLLAQTDFGNMEALLTEATKISPELRQEIKNISELKLQSANKRMQAPTNSKQLPEKNSSETLATPDNLEKFIKIKYSIED
jgi:hypothetical protein